MNNQPLVIGGKYRHFKGKEYRLISVAKHSETLEYYVVYQKLYDDGALWVRPKEMFFEDIEKPEYNGPRFTYIKN